jgi:nucleoid DNA-binding protein
MERKVYDLSRPDLPQVSGGRFSKSDLAAVLAHVEGMSMSQANRCVGYLIDGVVFALLQGCEVYLPKLGKLSVRLAAGRMGRHPISGEALHIPPTLRGHFQIAGPTRELLEKHLLHLKPQEAGGGEEEEEEEEGEEAEGLS